jgi:NADPH:quinone reductase
MKAWLLDSLTGLSALHLGQAPDPVPAAGEVVLRVKYAALNPADRYLAEGEYPAKPSFPHILGRDGLGIVEETGEKRLILRGPVGVSKPGTFAEKVAVCTDYLMPVPEGWSDFEAASAALVYLTAYQALTMWDDLPSAATVLITGASGGVGVAALQLARSLGYEVIALSRDAAKQARLRELGASAALDPTVPNWHKSLGKRIDLAIDNIGGPHLADVIAAMADRGRISCVGRLAGPVPQFNTASLFFRRLKLGGVAVGAYTAEEARAAWQEIVRLLARTGARPLIDSVHPFNDLPKAFERLKHGPMGKVILAVSEV